MVNKDSCLRKFGRAAKGRSVDQKGRVKDRICKLPNVEVFRHKNKVNWKLHDCIVASADKKKKMVKLSSCGWETKTTKDHMNGVLSELGTGKKVQQKKGVWYLNGKKFDDGDKVRFY